MTQKKMIQTHRTIHMVGKDEGPHPGCHVFLYPDGAILKNCHGEVVSVSAEEFREMEPHLDVFDSNSPEEVKAWEDINRRLYGSPTGYGR